jgi:hypothetical protein
MHESVEEPPSGTEYSDDRLRTAMVIGPSGQFFWTGSKWARTSLLPDRGDAGIAFNSMTMDLMSFGSGGCFGSGGNSSDTWVAADKGWITIPTANHPPERAGSYLVYDSNISGLVMFGGYKSLGCGGLT